MKNTATAKNLELIDEIYRKQQFKVELEPARKRVVVGKEVQISENEDDAILSRIGSIGRLEQDHEWKP